MCCDTNQITRYKFSCSLTGFSLSQAYDFDICFAKFVAIIKFAQCASGSDWYMFVSECREDESSTCFTFESK